MLGLVRGPKSRRPISREALQNRASEIRGKPVTTSHVYKLRKWLKRAELRIFFPKGKA